MISDKAFILAAGFGRRLKHFTADCPKPLVTVQGKTLLDHTIKHLRASGISAFVVNAHYRAAQIHAHAEKHYSDCVSVSEEPDILDTGGGIKNALSHFNGQPFFVLSGDGLWTDGPDMPALERMKNAWNPEIMDILMLLQPVSSMRLTAGTGDYNLAENGQAQRSHNQTGAYMFTSIRIHHPRIFEDTPDGPFSYLTLMDRAEQDGRLYGLVHDGDWHHISTPADLMAVREAYERQAHG